MQQKKVIIVDDERLARVELKALLSAFPELNVVGEAANADEGVGIIKETAPDLIFLDIHMPEKTGFDLLEELEEAPPVIFTTAYDEYAIKAFEFNALDYLLKPIQSDRLKVAIDRVLASKVIPEPDTTLANAPFLRQLYLKDGTQNYFVKLSEISLFSSFGNYVKVHFGDKPVLVHRSLNQLESRVQPTQFFRANRYALINVEHILEIQQGPRNKLIAILKSGHKIEFSERKSITFRDIWGI